MNLIDQGATFSPDRTFRYRLWRRWGSNHPLVVIGLNPSTADETIDDLTIRRCIGFAQRWNCGGLEMLNLFALRSTDPRELYRPTVEDCIGPENDRVICDVARNGMVLAAWGVHGGLRNRDLSVIHDLDYVLQKPVWCLGHTANGFPRHPLYIRGDTPYESYRKLQRLEAAA